MTRIIAINRPKIKPHRNSVRRPTPFGQGILPSAPHFRAPATLEDLAWAATMNSTEVSMVDEETMWDVLAREAAEVDRLCRGHCL